MVSEDGARRARFEQTVAAAYLPLQRYLSRRIDASTADDVLGDVLLVLWRRVDDIPEDAMLAWCYGVARGCLANARRGAERRERLWRRLTELPQPPHQTLPADSELHEALGSLPIGDREVLWLWAWEQLPPREIAVALGISPNAASIRLHRATRRLRQQLTRGKTPDGDGHLARHQETEATS